MTRLNKPVTNIKLLFLQPLATQGQALHTCVWWIHRVWSEKWVPSMPSHYIDGQAQCVLEIQSVAYRSDPWRLDVEQGWHGQGRKALERFRLRCQVDTSARAQAGRTYWKLKCLFESIFHDILDNFCDTKLKHVCWFPQPLIFLRMQMNAISLANDIYYKNGSRPFL